MRYTVVWRRRAEAQLAGHWLRAANKGASAGYTEQIDRILARDPSGQGESRQGNYRVWFHRPLLVLFYVNEPVRTVGVAAVKWVGH